jgi:hypothetical protein
MHRREVLGAIAGVAIAWPVACHAQAVTRKRHVGAFPYLKEKDSEAQVYAAA